LEVEQNEDQFWSLKTGAAAVEKMVHTGEMPVRA